MWGWVKTMKIGPSSNSVRVIKVATTAAATTGTSVANV